MVPGVVVTVSIGSFVVSLTWLGAPILNEMLAVTNSAMHAAVMSLIKQAININLTFSSLFISIQYQAHSVENKGKYQLGDY